MPLAPTGVLQVDVVGDKLILGPAESVRREIVPKIPLIFTWARIDVAQHWHERFHREPGNQWIRSVFAELFTSAADKEVQARLA